MAYDENLANRLEKLLADKKGITETRMFGGFGYLLNGNMCAGIHKESIMLRMGVDRAERILNDPGVKPMDFTGRIIRHGSQNKNLVASFCK